MTTMVAEPTDLLRAKTLLASTLRDSAVVAERSLGSLTTYRVGGAARLFVDVESVADLDAVAAAVSATNCPVLIVGKGSNMLVADAGFDGLAIRLGDGFTSCALSSANGNHLIVGGGASLPVVARASVGHALAGFEWAVGVPGSMGGAVRMNAGGHGSDMAASLVSVSIIDLHTGNAIDVAASELSFTYRSSAVKAHQVVVAATVALADGDPKVGQAEIAEIVRWRREHQPGGQNAGSVFTNPVGDSAGRLIDAAGLKGLRIGSAEVSPKHANFIQADPGGSATDVAALMATIAKRVFETFGIELHPETHTVGFDQPREHL